MTPTTPVAWRRAPGRLLLLALPVLLLAAACTPNGSNPPPPGVPDLSDTPVLVCIRSHESANVQPSPWWAYNPAGPYYGAYQYVQGTWNNAASEAGRDDLVGVPPIEPDVAWYDQDAVTLNFINNHGTGPWGGTC